MLLFEINEFNPRLLKIAERELDLVNIRKLLRLKRSKTLTKDKKERFGLDPWVQWVSIHTGKPSTQHGIRHLGDAQYLAHDQLWETLDQHGISTGIWGAMNARRGKTLNCKFFFPDPWMYSEQCYPDILNDFLMLPRYYAKNYGDLDLKEIAKYTIQFFKFFLRGKVFFDEIVPLIPFFSSSLLRHGAKDYLLFSLYDLMSTTLFCYYHRKYQPEFSILFINSIAHLQHHKWTLKHRLSAEMKLAFEIFDKILGIIFHEFPDSTMIIANGLTQTNNYNAQKILYRQKNPEQFLQAVGIKYKRVYQLMTNDAHVIFESQNDLYIAAKLLDSAVVNGKKIFDVEIHEKQLKLFFQSIFWNHLEKNSILVMQDKNYNFFDLFEKIGQSSGAHKPTGYIFSSGITFPENIYNYELHRHIIKYFKIYRPAVGNPAQKKSPLAKGDAQMRGGCPRQWNSRTSNQFN